MNYQENSAKGVCPSDRQLALRAKLQTGWSSSCKRVALNTEEQQAILSVIQRNEQLEMVEKERVSRLVERVERIKQRVSYYGPKNCSLCGQSFGFGLFLNMTHKHNCVDCKKPVCSHCSVDIPCSSSPTKKNICLCHVCSEIRDVWKKTGAWFYKGLPTYEPSKSRSNSEEKCQLGDMPLLKKSPKLTKLGMEIDSDDDEDEIDNAREEPKIIKNGSFSSGFLRNRNLFNLRLSTADSTSSRLTINDNTASSSSLPKKSPISPYSRQTSSSDSQKSANSLQQPQMMSENCWENVSGNSSSASRRRNSISSCYSITTEGNESFSIYQNYSRDTAPICLCLGWLEVSLNYEELQNTLKTTIIRARDLPGMDCQGLSDPFAKVNIITGDAIRHTRWQKSRIAHRSINPEFNETFSFLGMSVEDLSNSQLYVVILDDDKYGNDFLGACKIPLASILNCGPCRITSPLGAEDKFSMESLSCPTGNGQILIALCYNTQKRSLIVVIKRCINLLAMDKNGLSDPFVKIQLRPDSSRKKYKTAVKWRNLNPVFNEEFSFETSPNSLDKQMLVVTVWDKDIGKSNDFLGCLMLGEQCSKGRRLKQWRDCLLLPDQYHEQWHSLGAQLPPHIS